MQCDHRRMEARCGARSATVYLAVFGLAALPACHKSDFTPTTAYAGARRAVDTVQILTARPPAQEYRTVGIVTATGSSFEDALARARREGAEQGCDAVLLLGDVVESGYGGLMGPSLYVTRDNLRMECLVAEPGIPAAATSLARPGEDGAMEAALTDCDPECRQGYDCYAGRCLSACNPPCPEGQQCIGHGRNVDCVPFGTTIAPPPSAAPAGAGQVGG